MNDDREVRCLVQGLELRAAPPDSDSPGTMVGYAAVFSKRSLNLGGFCEEITPGAFRKALEKSDIRALANHDPNRLLGRESAGTLRLKEDNIGLRTEVDLPNTTVGRDTAESIRRGDMDGMSFAFTVSGGGADWDRSGDVPIRTIRSFGRVLDIGPVTYPAYADTSVAMRSLDAYQQQESIPTEPEPTQATAPEGDEVRDFLTDAKARLRLAEATLS